MKSFIVILILALCIPVAAMAEGPAQLIGSVEAVYHEGLVTFQVEHTDAVSSSIKVYDLSTDALVYDSGPRARTLVSWPAGHDLVGAFRYVVTAWNERGEVVVSQAAVTKNLTPISNITFDTIPGDTKLLGPNEVIVESDLQVGATQGVRLDQNINSHGGGAYFYEEDGSTTYAWMNPDFDGQGGFFHIKGSAASGGYIQAQGMDSLAGAQASLRVEGTSDFGVYAGLTGTESVVLPSNAVSSFEIANEAGLASTSTQSGVGLEDTPVNVLERTIIVPTNGYVLAIANAEGLMYHVNGSESRYVCTISDTSQTHALVQSSVFLAPTLPSGGYNIPVAVSRILPVTSGAHTFYLVCSANDVTGANNTGVRGRRLDLLFVPTAYGTVTAPLKVVEGQMEGVEDHLHSPTGLSQAEIDGERAESIAFNLARIQAELAELQAQADALAGPGGNQP